MAEGLWAILKAFFIFFELSELGLIIILVVYDHCQSWHLSIPPHIRRLLTHRERSWSGWRFLYHLVTSLSYVLRQVDYFFVARLIIADLALLEVLLFIASHLNVYCEVLPRHPQLHLTVILLLLIKDHQLAILFL